MFSKKSLIEKVLELGSFKILRYCFIGILFLSVLGSIILIDYKPHYFGKILGIEFLFILLCVIVLRSIKIIKRKSIIKSEIIFKVIISLGLGLMLIFKLISENQFQRGLSVLNLYFENLIFPLILFVLFILFLDLFIKRIFPFLKTMFILGKYLPKSFNIIQYVPLIKISDFKDKHIVLEGGTQKKKYLQGIYFGKWISFEKVISFRNIQTNQKIKNFYSYNKYKVFLLFFSTILFICFFVYILFSFLYMKLIFTQ